MRNFILVSSILLGVASAAQGDAASPARDLMRPARVTVTAPVTLLGTAVFGVCNDLAQGRMDGAMSQATSCCDKPACARLLSTIILKHAHGDLRT
jgi:hypothetical protein